MIIAKTGMSEMPEACGLCSICNEDSWCHAGNHYTERHEPRPSWCPLEEIGDDDG